MFQNLLRAYCGHGTLSRTRAKIVDVRAARTVADRFAGYANHVCRSQGTLVKNTAALLTTRLAAPLAALHTVGEAAMI